MEKRIEEKKLLYCIRELLMNFSGREVIETMKSHGYSEERIKDTIEFLKRETPDLSDLSTINHGNELLEKVCPLSEKLEKLKIFVLNKKHDEILLEDYSKPNSFVLGFDPDINIISRLADSLNDKDPRIVGGASFLLRKVGNIKSIEKLISALDNMKKLSEKNPGGSHENEYEPSDYEFAESIIGNSIVAISLNSKFSREGKIEFRRLVSTHMDSIGSHRIFYWNFVQVKFDLKTKQIDLLQQNK